MLVLHGFWSPADGLCLWAEDSDLAVKSASQALRTARAHPRSLTAGRNCIPFVVAARSAGTA